MVVLPYHFLQELKGKRKLDNVKGILLFFQKVNNRFSFSINFVIISKRWMYEKYIWNDIRTIGAIFFRA